MYTIYVDGVCIYSDIFAVDDMRVINPKLTLEDCAAGSLSITLPPSNKAYGTITRLTSDIWVEKEGVEIWSGRVLSETKDFWNNRNLVCEGALAFFNDSSQPPHEYPGRSIREYMIDLIAVHNSKVAPNRQFQIGVVTVNDDDFPTRYTNNEKTIELLNALVEKHGGHLRVRKENGIRYVDYLKDCPDTCTQTIQFGANLIEFTRNWDSTEFATVIVPLGARLDKSPIEALDAYLTVESVNGGRMYVQSDEAVAAYGWIEKVVTWDKVTDPDVLLRKARQYLADLQFDTMKIEVSALDLHYLDVQYEAVKLLDEIRVISRPHGLDRLFPVTKLEIPLDSPQNAKFTLGDSVQVSLTTVNNQTNSAILEKIEQLPKAHNILKEAKDNATQIMNMATTGFITITKDNYGSENLYISNTRDYTVATKYWKWNLNGLAYYGIYEGEEYKGPQIKTAITMDGAIVADFITAGVLNGNVLRVGVIQDYNSNVVLDLDNGTFTMKKGSINLGNGNFTVDSNGKMYAGGSAIFAGRLAAASGTFGGQLVAATGNFKGVVQAQDFLDIYGNSMMTNSKFKSDYLDLYGITITNRNTGQVSFKVASDGVVTINGKVVMGAGSSINWAQVSNQNITSNPAYSLANSAYNLADSAYDEARSAYRLANSIEMPSYIKSTYIGATTIKSPVIEGGEFYGSEFNVIAGRSYGSFNLYGSYGSSRYHFLTISYYEGDAPYISIYSPAGGYITIGRRNNGLVEMDGTIWFNDTVYFYGTVDFRNATVRGLD